jgi:hypothetical protein
VRKRTFRTTVAGGAVLALVAGLFVGLGPLPGSASSHREAPLISTTPQLDSTDLYAFVSPDKPDTVTLISNWIPFEEPAGGPNYYWFAPNTYYDINIDNDRDAKPDVIYRWVYKNHRTNPNTFLYNTNTVTSLTDPDLVFYQTYNLFRINGDTGAKTTLLTNAMVAPVDVGAASMPNYQADLRDPAVVGCGTDCTTYTGPADDPFFVELRVFDLLYGGNLSEAGDDTVKGYNIHTTAIQVSKDDVAAEHDGTANPLIGVWTTAEKKTDRIVKLKNGRYKVTHPYVQVDRLGLPLVNEVVVPTSKKDAYNASKPVNDLAFLGGGILDPELPHLIQAVYGVPAPAAPRNDLLPLAVGFTALGWPAFTGAPGDTVPSDLLRLNMSIAPCTSGCSRLGVLAGDNAGFPNGRRLDDDVLDIEVRVFEGVLLTPHNAFADTASDGVDTNDATTGATFPYLALPHAGSEANPH